MGFEGLSHVVYLGTDSSAAKSFVSRRGLGKMRHIEIRDLWLQKEAKEGKAIVHKIPGTENPADLMTKILTVRGIVDRLRGTSMHVYKEGEVSCVYTYTHTFGEPLEICCVSASPEDQVYAPPVCTNRNPMKHCTSSASCSANRESTSPSNKNGTAGKV